MPSPVPASRPFARDPMHRLIPSRFSEAGTVLAEVADSDEVMEAAILLDGATNDRILGEEYGLAGISTYELLYGVPDARIVNAAFTHSAAAGGRFHDATRGAWYAAAELRTSIEEVAYHKARRLGEIVVPGLPGERPDQEVSTYDDWQAGFQAEFHVLEPTARYNRYLRPEPVPACYADSQKLAKQLLDSGSNGIVYPSVRRRGHTCLVCFRPALVYHLRRSNRFELEFTASPTGYRHRAHQLS